MTFKKFEFWLVTIISLVIMASFAGFVLENSSGKPGSGNDAATLPGRIGIVLLSYLAFLILNNFVFGRLYQKRKIDLMVVLCLLTLVSLLTSFYYLDVLFPHLFRGLDYLPITASIFALFCGYEILKKVIGYYGGRVGEGQSKNHVRRKILKEVVWGFVVWFFIFIVIMNADYRVQFLLRSFWSFWVPCAFITIMLNIYWIIPQHEKEGKKFSAFFVKAFIVSLLLSFVFGVPFAHGGFWGFAFFVSTQLIISVPLAWFIYQSNKEKIQELLSLKKELGRTTADLQFLRSQINPHFLFNALNTLYGTALQENSERTAVGIQKLGDMMRFMLHENVQDAIPLEKEVEYLLNYISLQQLRTLHSDDIKIDVQLDEAHLQYRIAPMLLIPFVENAFKHGISLKEMSWIKIHLSCRNNKLYFDVYNSIHSKNERDPEKDKSGIGLANVQQRLEMIYPERHELIVRETASEFIVHLTLTFEPLKATNLKYSEVSTEEADLGIRSSALQ